LVRLTFVPTPLFRLHPPPKVRDLDRFCPCLIIGPSLAGDGMDDRAMLIWQHERADMDPTVPMDISAGLDLPTTALQFVEGKIAEPGSSHGPSSSQSAVDQMT